MCVCVCVCVCVLCVCVCVVCERGWGGMCSLTLRVLGCGGWGGYV